MGGGPRPYGRDPLLLPSAWPGAAGGDRFCGRGSGFRGHTTFAGGRERWSKVRSKLDRDPEPGPPRWSGLIDWNNFVAVHLAVSPTGDVLIFDREEGLTTAWRWDPNTGTFTNTPGLVDRPLPRFPDRLPGGKLVVVGGTALKKGAGGPPWAALAWIRPVSSTGRRTPGASRRRCTPRWYPTMVALPDGRQVVLGGQLTKGVMATLSEVYDPANNTWTSSPGWPSPSRWPLPAGHRRAERQDLRGEERVEQSAYMDVDTQTWTTVTRPRRHRAVEAWPCTRRQGADVQHRLDRQTSPGSSTSTPRTRVAQVGSLHYRRKKFSTVSCPTVG